MSRSIVIFVDVDDTLVRSFGSKRITMTLMVERIRKLKVEGATLFLWSSGGAAYCEKTALELGIEDCFEAFLPKPEVCIDDVSLRDWRGLVELHPNEAHNVTVQELRDRLPW